QRRVILQFFYAVSGVKSNQLEWNEVGMVSTQTARLLAVMALCLCGLGAAQTPPPLAIVDDSLPTLGAGVEVRVPLHATGGIPPYHWSAPASDLPEGIVLTSEGFLAGRPTKPGAFALTLTVEDSGRPAHSVSKTFRALVTAALLLDWLRPPLIHGNRVDGAVQVSNGSKDDFDLTVIIVAVNAVGRATALGYQHFNLKAGATSIQISFGETLPPGAYVVHADAVAEVTAKNSILRQRLQTPVALPVILGP
ncbi:MAG: putative Ig domain-containing protein, partial [Acidobacteriia bacterium]|nr:putative Ig domain-containing protein [Terriglobia bacterium]